MFFRCFNNATRKCFNYRISVTATKRNRSKHFFSGFLVHRLWANFIEDSDENVFFLSLNAAVLLLFCLFLTHCRFTQKYKTSKNTQNISQKRAKLIASEIFISFCCYLISPVKLSRALSTSLSRYITSWNHHRHVSQRAQKKSQFSENMGKRKKKTFTKK